MFFSHHDVHVENYSKKKKLEKSFGVRGKYLQVASYMDNQLQKLYACVGRAKIFNGHLITYEKYFASLLFEKRNDKTRIQLS